MRNDTKYYGIHNVGCQLEKAHQILTNDLSKTLAEVGIDITVPEYLVLRTLYVTDGLQQCEIADILSKDRASVCRSINSLSRKNLVQTEAVSYKCQRVYLTDESRRLKSEIISVAEKCHRRLQHVLTPDRVNDLSNILNLIINKFI